MFTFLHFHHSIPIFHRNRVLQLTKLQFIKSLLVRHLIHNICHHLQFNELEECLYIYVKIRHAHFEIAQLHIRLILFLISQIAVIFVSLIIPSRKLILDIIFIWIDHFNINKLESFKLKLYLKLGGGLFLTAARRSLKE